MKFERALRDLFQEDASSIGLSPLHKHVTLTRARNRRKFVAVTGTILLVAVVATGVGVSKWTSQRVSRVPVIAAEPNGSALDPSAAPSVDGATHPTHTCETRLVGEGGVAGDGKDSVPEDWRRQSVMVGPLGLFRADDFSRLPESRFEAIGQDTLRYDGLAFYAIVPAGEVATISVPPSDQDHLALLFDPSAGDGPPYNFQDGESAITLEACEEMDTEFLEAFLVKGSRCADVVVESMRGRTFRARLSFGAGSCP